MWHRKHCTPLLPHPAPCHYQQFPQHGHLWRGSVLQRTKLPARHWLVTTETLHLLTVRIDLGVSVETNHSICDSVIQVYGFFPRTLERQHRLPVWEERQLLWHWDRPEESSRPVTKSQSHRYTHKPSWPGVLLVPGVFVCADLDLIIGWKYSQNDLWPHLENHKHQRWIWGVNKTTETEYKINVFLYIYIYSI